MPFWKENNTEKSQGSREKNVNNNTVFQGGGNTQTQALNKREKVLLKISSALW